MRKFFATYSFISLLSLFLIFSGKGRRLRSVKIVSDFFLFPLQSSIRYVEDCVKAKKKNEFLENEVIKLSLENQKLKETKEENLRLKNILQFKEQFTKRIEPLIVLSSYEEAGNLYLLCKRRGYFSVSKNEAVMGFFGIIGKVNNATGNIIQIQTLQHVNSRVVVIDSRSRVFGILIYKGYFILDGIPSTADVAPGDTLISSGMGAIYPKGINVAIVKKIEKNPLNYKLKVIVKPIENLQFQEEVFVLKSE